jgi:hypothetical protein
VKMKFGLEGKTECEVNFGMGRKVWGCMNVERNEIRDID